MLRLPIYALLALGACGSVSPAGDGMATEWLVDQYFSGRQTIVLPDLTRPISVAVGIYEPGPPPPAGGPVDFGAGHGVGDMLREYYPFLHSVTDAGLGSIRYAPGEAGAILDNETREVGVIAAYAKGSGNLLQLKAVRSDMVDGLAKAARAKNWTVVYRTPRCVIATKPGTQPDQRYTSAFIGGDGPVWDLDDARVERCALAGILQAFGMDVPGVMARADKLYPHKVGLNQCPLAVASVDAIEERDWRAGLRCKSRARAAWPFEVLRHAAAIGRLKAGPISRAAFAAAMAAAAEDLGEDRRREILQKEEASLQMADQADIPNPVPR